jgi:DNA-binding PadR family transcriptional regulator
MDKLKGNELLTATMIPGETHLMRKEYKITSTGRRVFLDWATSPVRHGREMRQEFLAKLYFAQQSGLLVSLELIEEQKTVCTEWLASFEASLSKLTDEQYFEKILFSYRLSQTQAMLAWLDDSCVEIQTAHTRLQRIKT